MDGEGSGHSKGTKEGRVGLETSTRSTSPMRGARPRRRDEHGKTAKESFKEVGLGGTSERRTP